MKKILHRVIKLRIYPNESQIQIIEQTLGTLRFLYNHYLSFNKQLYLSYKNGKVDKGFIGRMKYYKDIYPRLKEEYPWISECSDKCSRQGVLDEAEDAIRISLKVNQVFLNSSLRKEIQLNPISLRRKV